MSDFEYEIVLELRYGGFTGSHLDKLMHSDVIIDHPISCRFMHSSTCEGPDSWRIFLIVASPFAVIGTAMLKKLADDLYDWFKTRLKDVFSERSNGDGYCELRFEDVIIEIHNHPSEECFADIWLDLSQITKAQDLSLSKRWVVVYDNANLTTTLVPTK